MNNTNLTELPATLQASSQLPSAPHDDRIVQALAEFCHAAEAGQPMGRQALLDKYADVADDLAGCLDSLDFIQNVAPQLKGQDDVEGSRSHTRIRPQATLGDFRILREIGRGGMGVVYEAEQISLHRRVALKVLPFAAILDGTNLKRFKNEALAAATLDHPHIVSVYCVGCERGVHYYAMQFIDGQNLATTIHELRRLTKPSGVEGTPLAADYSALTADFISTGLPMAQSGAVPVERQGDQSPSSSADTHPKLQAAVSTARSIQTRAYFQNVARLGIQAAQALDHAHAHGILHRDIKPSNLLIDAEGQLWVTDFGLARIESDVGMTMTGDVLGTLRYMCPETAAGGSKHFVVDQRADIYSLGVTLYELLTLQPAFAGQDRKQLFQKIVFAEPRSPRQISKAIPTELETIVLKAMRKDPTDRYATAGDLADDLQRFLNAEPIRAKPPTLLERTVMWSRRNRGLVAAATILLAMFVLLLMVTAALVWRAQQRTARALQEAEQNAAESKAVVNFLITDLLGSAAPEKSLGREVAVNEVLANAEQKIDTAFRDQPLVEAAVRHAMGLTYYQLGKREEASLHFSEARKIATRQLGAEHPNTLRSTNGLANVLRVQGRLQEARQLHEEVIAIRRRELGAEHADTLESMNNLAAVYRDQGRLDEACRLYEQALDARRRILGVEHPDTLISMNNLGVMLSDQGQLPEARALHEQTVDIRRRVLGPGHPATLDSMHNLATVLLDQGQLEEAHTVLAQALEISRRVMGAEHPATLSTGIAIGSVLANQGQLDEARKLFAQTLEVQRRVLGGEHFDTLATINNLGTVLYYQGRLEEARRLLQPALEVQRRVLGDEHPNTLSLKINVANVLSDQGQLDEARQLYEESVEVQRRILGDEHPNTLISMNNLADVLHQQGQLQEARILHEQTLEIRRRSLGAEHPHTLLSMDSLADVFRDQGKLEEACRLYQQKIDIEIGIGGVKHPDTLKSISKLAWLLATYPDQRFQGARRAVELASQAVEFSPATGAYQKTLGVAHYRAGSWSAAIEALEKSLELQGENGCDLCFLAMAHWQLGHHDDAQQFYDQAVAWIHGSDPENKELQRFLAEASTLLGVTSPFQSTDQAARQPPAPPVVPTEQRKSQDDSTRQETNQRRQDSKQNEDLGRSQSTHRPGLTRTLGQRAQATSVAVPTGGQS